MVFYNENKAVFESENPGLTPAELTKFAMNKFRQMHPAKSNGTTVDSNDDTNKSKSSTAKRKINTEDNERSGIAKLAKFSFKKQ